MLDSDFLLITLSLEVEVSLNMPNHPTELRRQIPVDVQTKVRVVLQARTDSHRLPGKSMMQVAGFPLAILAGLRAANTGLEVLLATTKRSVDDLLVEAAISAGLPVYRGETDNVTQRLIDSCIDLADNAILVRLTGDNVLPDGDLIEEVLDHFINTNQIFTSTVKCQVPYGISVEVMRIGTLKKSLNLSQTEFDVEHVTPPLDRTFPDSIPPIKHPDGDLRKYRCTVDTQSDFEVIKHLFSTVDSPVSEGWRKLVSLLINDIHASKEDR